MSTSHRNSAPVQEIRLLSTVILMRHGQYNQAAPNQLGGLTALGRRQVAHAAERLAAEPLDRIVASEFRRAQQTAEEVARHHPSVTLEADADLCECVPSVPRGQEFFYPEGVQASQTAACRERLDRAYARYFESHAEGTTLLVGHGNAFRYLLCRVIAVRLDAWSRFDIHNTGICRIASKTLLGTQVTGFNDTGHLAASMLTYS